MSRGTDGAGRDFCPLCREPTNNWLANHLQECPAREDALAYLEEQRRRRATR